jgi:hypothetical protein
MAENNLGQTDRPSAWLNPPVLVLPSTGDTSRRADDPAAGQRRVRGLQSASPDRSHFAPVSPNGIEVRRKTPRNLAELQLLLLPQQQ